MLKSESVFAFIIIVVAIKSGWVCIVSGDVFAIYPSPVYVSPVTINQIKCINFKKEELKLKLFILFKIKKSLYRTICF